MIKKITQLLPYQFKIEIIKDDIVIYSKLLENCTYITVESEADNILSKLERDYKLKIIFE